MRNDFTLFYRKVPSGKKVVYYYAYNDEGERLGPWSTGLGNKTAARNFCNSLIRHGILIPGVKGMTSFEVYAADFWDSEKSEYLRNRRKRRTLTQWYIDNSKRVTETTLLPYYGKMRLERITGEVIEKWQDHMIAEKYESTTINNYYSVLMTMMKWAAKKRYIQRDPFLDVQKLREVKKEKKLITQDEFKTMFVDNWKAVWDNDFLLCTANKLAALSGLRAGEILGLRGEYVFDDHVFICNQYHIKYGDRETKGKTKDHIPLAAEMIADLKKLKKKNGNGYVFSLTKGLKPVTLKYIYVGLRKALNNIGINNEQIKERGLNVHAWRHFCNTEMLKSGIPIKKVQAITRHKTEDMTDRYTHFDPLEFTDVTDLQMELLKKKPATAKKEKLKAIKNERPALTLVKVSDDDVSAQNKKAS
jgi:integrase